MRPSILPGFLELLPEDQVLFEKMIGRIKGVYESFVFLPMDTPVIEKSEVLLAKSQGETSKQVYRFMQGEKDVTLRYDLTVPFARYIAMNEQQLAFPFMRYQIGKVYRGEKNQKGRFREFYQCDIDIVGRGKLALSHDALVIFVASCVLKAIGLKAYCMRISNRKLMKGLVRIWHLEEKEEAFLSLLDKYMKLETKVFNALLEEIMGKEKCEVFLNLLQTKDQERLLAKLEMYKEKDALFDEGLEEIKKF